MLHDALPAVLQVLMAPVDVRIDDAVVLQPDLLVVARSEVGERFVRNRDESLQEPRLIATARLTSFEPGHKTMLSRAPDFGRRCQNWLVVLTVHVPEWELGSMSVRRLSLIHI